MGSWGLEKRVMALFFFLGVLFFAGNSLMAVTDPVECNYALTAKEMLESGDYLSPRIFGHYWYDKPAFFYWEIMLGYSIFGMTEFAARFFSAVFALLTAFLAYAFARRLYDERTGIYAALILGTSLIYFCLAKLIITDMALMFFFSAIMVFFYLGWQTGQRKLYYACYAFAGLAVLTKGPIGILLPGFVMVVYLLSRRKAGELLRLHWPLGILIFLVTGGSWYYAMYGLHGEDFLHTFLGIHNYLRATVSEHPKDNVWYYYLAIFFLGFLPWSPLFLRELWKKCRMYGKRSLAVLCEDPALSFLALWAVLVTGFYQCMATKYPTYSFPAFFPLAILAAYLLRERGRLVYRLAVGTGVVYLLVIYLAAVPFSEQRSGRGMSRLLVEHARAEDLVVSYGNYATSIVLYRSAPMYYLKDRAAIERDVPKPGDLSWNAKNVMEHISFEKLPVEQDFYVVCAKNNRKELLNRLPVADMEELGEDRKNVLLRLRLAGPAHSAE